MEGGCWCASSSPDRLISFLPTVFLPIWLHRAPDGDHVFAFVTIFGDSATFFNKEHQCKLTNIVYHVKHQEHNFHCNPPQQKKIKKIKICIILCCMFVTLPPRPDHAVMLSVSREAYGSPAKQVRQKNLVIHCFKSFSLLHLWLKNRGNKVLPG